MAVASLLSRPLPAAVRCDGVWRMQYTDENSDGQPDTSTRRHHMFAAIFGCHVREKMFPVLMFTLVLIHIQAPSWSLPHSPFDASLAGCRMRMPKVLLLRCFTLLTAPIDNRGTYPNRVTDKSRLPPRYECGEACPRFEILGPSYGTRML